jgi:hypothetical protein
LGVVALTAPTFKPPINPAGWVSDDHYGLLLDEFIADTPTDLIWPHSVQTYAAMRRDSCVSAVLDGYLLQLLRAQWQLDGRGCDPELTKMVADDMGLPIVGAEPSGAARVRGVSWEQHIESALATKLTFGHAGYALGADLSSGQARLSVLADRLPQTLTQIHADPKSGDFLGVTQDAPRKNGQPQIAARNMVWYCRRREGANWAGTSIFRSAWVPFLIKKEMLRIHATANRRWGMGVPVMEAHPGTSPSPAQMTEAMQMAAAARGGEQAGAASPPGFTMKVMGLTGSVPQTLDFIRWLDMQISRAALMPHIELGQGTSGGSRALGSTFVDSWLLALETLAAQTAMEATRQIAARIVGWNRGDQESVPQVVVSGIGSRREVTAESLNQLIQSGALSSDPALEAWVRREYRLPEREEQDGRPAPSGRIFEHDVTSGVITRNERRAQIGLPPVEGGDTLADPDKPAAPAPAVPEPKVTAKRKRQADGQLALPIAAAADDEADRVQHDFEAALAALLAAWPALAAPLVADLAAQAAASTTADLATLAASTATVAEIEAALSGAMLSLADKAAAQVVASAAAQGVTVEQPSPDDSRIVEVAAVTAALIGSAYTSAAVRRAMLAPAGTVATAVRAALDDMSQAQRGTVADSLGAALSTAQGHGRLGVLAAAPAVAYVADEVNDRSRCAVCAAADQKRYESLADALRDYPNGIQNAACEGGARCRGHLVPVWS